MSPDAIRSASRPRGATEQEVRQRLDHERASRLTQLEAITEERNEAPRELMLSQRAAIHRVLTEIEAAFARLERGTYGRCEGCAGPVPEERLEILPYARCCVACQRRAV
ncbi:TraR/DksA family transcriptional regulator [Streptomyces genisteinicus]|uniref:TraR/DksA C4-type zinc finger protein n=1 Tax=Streptomyces genisteinicus TaxID=2768068 RepID=A0A7H0HN84_9ACTN|nr:TraR/DksA C4-type zinc finger protein [Streptomyces genisteinicus]QNP62000.1 TraR/DksA C4-type zinc finger protein [Streptomyces genisteinicus]